MCIMQFDIALVNTLTEILNRRNPEGTKSETPQKTSSYTNIQKLQDSQKAMESAASEVLHCEHSMLKLLSL